jgi:hypothetical protein
MIMDKDPDVVPQLDRSNSGECITLLFSARETEAFLSSVKFLGMMANTLHSRGEEDRSSLETTLEIQMQRYEKGEMPDLDLGQGDMSRVKGVIQKLDTITSRLPLITVCGVINVPEGKDTEAFLKEVISTGGSSERHSETDTPKPMISADNKRADDILRGKEHPQLTERDFMLLVYDQTRLRQVGPEEEGYNSNDPAFIARDGETFQSALAAALFFERKQL